MSSKRRQSRFSSALIRRAVVTAENAAPPTLRDPSVLARAESMGADQYDVATLPGVSPRGAYLDLDPVVLAEQEDT